MEGSAETLGGAAETVETFQLNYSCEAEETITVRKNELNLLSKNSIRIYDVIIT